jgi:hypothetical protein
MGLRGDPTQNIRYGVAQRGRLGSRVAEQIGSVRVAPDEG